MALWVALACGFFLFSFFYLLAMTKIAPKTQVKGRVQQLRRPVSLDERVRFESEQLNRPFAERLILPLFRRLEERLIRLAPARIFAVLAERIMKAGKQHSWSINTFVCFWLISSLGFFVITGFFAFYANPLPFLQGVALSVCGLIIGAALPVAFLDWLIAIRRKAILRQLPDVLDLLCISVQAGLSFDGAMARVAEKMNGPLIEECSKMLRDVRMGMTRRQALANLAERCKIQEVYLFTSAVVQSDRLGVSMAKTLAIQSENMRERRRQTVKEQALKAPVKMLLPLAVFIFPALFIVIMLPTLFSILNNLKALGK
ncbi:type II secretion system F family protein|uniref:Tight adherence protein C n=1 Tax=Dendrosporobacter quercicolus TaxID=146817 RepID=A0A1H0A2Y0_9FIRM|nr:type II secretion system F family protein [Dendrosporobacter quercicolus]NSL49996.1 type II secretion system F family protein [Dendrosporobacter quercicolus DSM 1736]SDN27928.1 tight adherence protein C [Dendrosporobacter quercicolus]